MIGAREHLNRADLARPIEVEEAVEGLGLIVAGDETGAERRADVGALTYIHTHEGACSVDHAAVGDVESARACKAGRN